MVYLWDPSPYITHRPTEEYLGPPITIGQATKAMFNNPTPLFEYGNLNF